MKRKLLTALLAVFLAAIALIVVFLRGSVFFSDELQADARMRRIVSAINDQDAKKLKGLFSSKALAECDEIDSQITELFEFLDGSIVSWEQEGISSSERSDRGKKMKMIRPFFLITTEEESYYVSLIDFPKDTIDRQNKGLYSLMIRKTSYDGLVPPWNTQKAGIIII